MPKTRASDGLRWIALVAACLLASPVLAAQPGAPPSAEAKTEARDRFDRGLRLFDKGDHASALAEFKRAYDLVPNPLVLYNMGLVYAALNRPVEAVDALDAFLARAEHAQRGQRRHAEDVRGEQSGRIARLLVETAMPAAVAIDGVDVGQTPLAEPLRVASGTHLVSVQASGFLPARREVTLAGQVVEKVSFALQPAEARMAQLAITSTPGAAEVSVNGQSVGTTPLPASVAVAPGMVTVEVRRVGYRSATRTLALGDGARGELAFTLDEDASAPAASKGVLRVAASEPDAEIRIDGVPRKGAARVVLPAGPHQLEVLRPGFEPYQQSIAVVAGQETALAPWLTPTLETRTRYEESARLRRIVGWSVLGAGAGLAIGAGIYGAIKVGDVNDARKNLDGVLADEKNPSSQCYAQGAEYLAHHCDEVHSYAQDRVDSAVLRRNLGFIGAGVGVLAAGVGTYLLLTTGEADRYRRPNVVVWRDQSTTGLSLAGRY